MVSLSLSPFLDCVKFILNSQNLLLVFMEENDSLIYSLYVQNTSACIVRASAIFLIINSGCKFVGPCEKKSNGALAHQMTIHQLPYRHASAELSTESLNDFSCSWMISCEASRGHWTWLKCSLAQSNRNLRCLPACRCIRFGRPAQSSSCTIALLRTHRKQSCLLDVNSVSHNRLSAPRHLTGENTDT